MDNDKPTFDLQDAIILYAAISAGEKGITSQGLVLLSDYVGGARATDQEIDRSLDRLQETGQLRRRGQAYFASRTAAEDCGPKIAQQPDHRAAIAEVLKYLLAQGPLTADAWRRTRPARVHGARLPWRGPKPGLP
ncbi:MAG: hypothetical protein NTY77_03295 [Elusimicrobia bacterium]|nr:hypothetical protein [Elusimicrobiota bacterium]